jgi:hypothetical protein
MISEYTFTCRQTGETQQVCVCAMHAKKMPPVDGDAVRAQPCEGDCELCEPPRTGWPKAGCFTHSDGLGPDCFGSSDEQAECRGT